MQSGLEVKRINERGARGTRKKSLTGYESAWYSIASELGCTVAELKARMTKDEFHGWIGFLKLRGETKEQRGQRVWEKLTVWANTHNANLKK